MVGTDVVGGLYWFLPYVVHSSCNLLDNITRVLSQPSFLFLPLTKLPHPNTIYRYIGHGVGSGVLAFELC